MCPFSKTRYTILPECRDVHTQQHIHQKDLNLCLTYDSAKLLMNGRKHKQGIQLFLVFLMRPSSSFQLVFGFNECPLSNLFLEHFWFCIRVLVYDFWFYNTNDFKSLLTPYQWIKNVSAKTTKYIPSGWERSVKRKSNLNFIRVIKKFIIWSTFSIYMPQTFLKRFWWQFLVPHPERLISSAISSCKTCNILMLVLQKAFFWEVSLLCMHWSVHFINQGFKTFELNFFILKCHCFMFLFNFMTFKYSLFRRITCMVPVFPDMPISWSVSS